MLDWGGIDIRKTADRLLFEAHLLTGQGALVTGGTTSLYLYELQSDGTIKSYDFDDDTFKTGALTTETVSMTHRKGNNLTTNTGLWVYALTTVTGFTEDAKCIALVVNTTAWPNYHVTAFQYGGSHGDHLYHAEFEVARDAANTKDYWTALWKRDGTVVPWAEIADPKIYVYKRSDGTTLINGEAMTRIGALAYMEYEGAGGEKMTSVEGYIIRFTATIDNVTREWVKLDVRDSS